MKYIICRVIIDEKVIKHHQIFDVSTLTRLFNKFAVSVDKLKLVVFLDELLLWLHASYAGVPSHSRCKEAPYWLF